jgi:hypothetical protein
MVNGKKRSSIYHSPGEEAEEGCDDVKAMAALWRARSSW